MKVAIVGAGPMGQALASVAMEAGTEVLLGYRSQSVRGIPTTSDPAELAAFAELVLFAVPAWELHATLGALPLGPQHRTVLCARGPDPESGTWLHELVPQLTPCLRVGMLAGPMVPTEVLSGHPGAAVIASPYAELRERTQQALHSPRCRVYKSDDIRGVELASAFARVLAVVAGVAEALQMGEAAHGLVTSRGLAEATRLGAALGAKRETFTGLAGLGELVASSGPHNLAFAAGQALVRGERHAEEDAFRSARALVRVAAPVKVELPLTEAIAAIATGEIDPREAFRALMERPALRGVEM